MRPAQLYLLLACLLATLASFAQNVAKDSLFIRYFGTADYRASAYNYSVTEDQNGILYFANENGVLEYDGSRWRLHPIPSYSHIVTVKMSPEGRLYVGGRNEFGYMQRDSVGAMQYVSLRELIDPDLELNEVWQIKFFKGQVFFQTYESLIRYDGELCHDTKIEHAWFYHQDDELYVSVYNEGLARLTKDSLEFLNRAIKFEQDNPQTTLKYEGREKILVTEYNGLFLIDTTNMQTRKWDVSANEDLIKHAVWDAMEWDDSTYLFSTIRGGLRWANKKGEIIKTLDKENGLKSHDLYSAHRDALNNLWLNGAGIHHVMWPTVNKADKSGALIRNLTINTLNLPIDKVDSSIESSIYGPIKSLALAFTTPGVDKADVQYSYILEGFDQEWSGWVDEASKEYTNLPGGDYTFKVRSKLVNGAELRAASLLVSIPTEWYNRPWAKVIGGILIWLMVVGVYKLRTKHLKAQNKKLEDVIGQRTGELRYANEELLKRNYELDQFVRRVSHDLVSPIKSVKALMDITREEDNKEEREKCFDMMSLSLNKQENFVRKLLDQAINYKEVNIEEVQLHEFCKELIKDLSSYDGAEHMNFVCEIESNFSLKSDPIRLKIVLKNLLENSVKYRKLDASNSAVTIRAYNDEKRVLIEVEDNGIGISEENLEQIFGMFKRATDQRHGTGLGLYIVKDVVSSLSGKIELASKPNEGSKFTLSFPISR